MSKFKSRQTATVVMEERDLEEVRQIASSRDIDVSTLLRGWILDRKTQINLSQEQ